MSLDHDAAAAAVENYLDLLDEQARTRGCSGIGGGAHKEHLRNVNLPLFKAILGAVEAELARREGAAAKQEGTL